MDSIVKQDFLSPLAKFNLWLMAALVAVEMVWAYFAGFSVDFYSFLTPIFVMVVMFSAGWFYSSYRPDKNLANLFIWTAVLFGAFASGMLLSYLSTSLNFPLMDKNFLEMDRMLGFDWIGYVKFITAEPLLLAILDIAYFLTLPMLAVVLIYLALSGKGKILEIYITTLLFTGIIVSFLCGFLPAVSVFTFLDLSAADFNGFKPVILDETVQNYFLRDFIALRDGSLRSLSLTDATGIISFPSFHAVLSLVTVLALRGTTWFYWVAVTLFIVTMFSVPIIGGHYFVDIIAGLLITVVSWKAALQLQEYLADKNLTFNLRRPAFQTA